LAGISGIFNRLKGNIDASLLYSINAKFGGKNADDFIPSEFKDQRKEPPLPFFL
jgi:hypothetical protein